jgi:hypothetical protein
MAEIISDAQTVHSWYKYTRNLEEDFYPLFFVYYIFCKLFSFQME